jgi:hypothetical protein
MALSMKSAMARGTARFGGRKVAGASNGSRVVMKAGNWLPGSETPAWLKDDIPGEAASQLN